MQCWGGGGGGMDSREKPSEGEEHVWVFSRTTLLIYTNQKQTSLSLATGNYIKYLSLSEGVNNQ